jgi:hypothetical protein
MRPMRAVVLLSLLLGPGCAAAAAAPAAEGPFTCTELIGVSTTGDWFGAGFEQGLDGNRWQARTRTHAFVEQWGDSRDPLWSVPVASPCARNAEAPDRVLFTGVSWELKTVEQWTAALEKVVQVLRGRDPGLRRIELLTMLRAPGNRSCGDDKSVVAPAIDQAVARVAAAHPGLVRAAPRFEAPSCAVFTKGGPHFTEAGMKAVAKLYAAHYGRP